MFGKWIQRWLPARRRYQRDLRLHAKGLIAGSYQSVPTTLPAQVLNHPQRIHFWTPHPSWPSAQLHVAAVLPHLRAQAAALALPWTITAGENLPTDPLDWLLCLKKAPPPQRCSTTQTVLLINDDLHRVWGRLPRFGQVVVVASPVLASLLGTVHPRVWFMEETESMDTIAHGQRALDLAPPSRRPPQLLWHGLRESLEGLRPLRPALETFARETDATLVVVTNLPATTESWGALRVQFVPWSPAALIAHAGQARLGLVPARPSLARSYLKSAGRQRRLFALGCPAIGDARSPDVVAFSRDCAVPAATTGADWLAALRAQWHDPAGLDALAQRGHALVRDRYSVTRTAAQWVWFLAGGASEKR